MGLRDSSGDRGGAIFLSSLDIEELLEPVTPDDPCGPDLEYDADFLEMNRLAQPGPERESGAIKEEAGEPDWRALKSKCLELARRTKHLRVGIQLAKAALKTEGFEGFVAGLGYLGGLLDRYWNAVHPTLDPNDNYDPTERVSILSELVSPDSFLRLVRETPLVDSPRAGRFSPRDILIAQGQMPAPDGKAPPTMTLIQAAMSDVGVEAVKAKDAAIEAAIQRIKGLEANLTAIVGAGRAMSFAPLVRTLQAAQAPLSQWLVDSGSLESPQEGGDAGSTSGESDNQCCGELPAAPQTDLLVTRTNRETLEFCWDLRANDAWPPVITAGSPEPDLSDNPSDRVPTAIDRSGLSEHAACSLFSPRCIAPGDTILVQLFVYPRGKLDEVTVEAKAADPHARHRGTRILSFPIARGSTVTVSLRARDLFIRSAVQSFVWAGDSTPCSFEVSVKGRQSRGVGVATAVVHVDGVPVGRISFTVEIVSSARATDEPLSRPVGEARHFNNVFVSYAAQDRRKVMARVQMLRLLGISFFQDVLSLDPGEHWRRSLLRHIDTCDGFFLFWSRFAKASPWVQREWRYALSNRGDEIIVPVPIDGPPVPAPPQELSHLHFDDRLLRFMGRGA